MKKERKKEQGMNNDKRKKERKNKAGIIIIIIMYINDHTGSRTLEWVEGNISIAMKFCSKVNFW